MFNEAKKVDYDEIEFDRVCKMYGMSKFVSSMNHLAECIKGSLTINDLEHDDLKLLEYIFTPDLNDGKTQSVQRWNIIKNTLSSG